LLKLVLVLHEDWFPDFGKQTNGLLVSEGLRVPLSANPAAKLRRIPFEKAHLHWISWRLEALTKPGCRVDCSTINAGALALIVQLSWLVIRTGTAILVSSSISALFARFACRMAPLCAMFTSVTLFAVLTLAVRQAGVFSVALTVALWWARIQALISVIAHLTATNAFARLIALARHAHRWARNAGISHILDTQNTWIGSTRTFSRPAILGITAFVTRPFRTRVGAGVVCLLVKVVTCCVVRDSPEPVLTASGAQTGFLVALTSLTSIRALLIALIAVPTSIAVFFLTGSI
jgi:hypothetical protein